MVRSLHSNYSNARQIPLMIDFVATEGKLKKAAKRLDKSIVRSKSSESSQVDFDDVLKLIDAARLRATSAVNTTLIELYWNIGQYISRKSDKDGWGKGTVEILAEAIKRRHPSQRGYSPQNLWRMRQFYEAYCNQPKLSALLRELSWTHNLLILGKSKRAEEREFYLRMACEQRWSSRELERQFTGALFERVILSPTKLSAPLREMHPDAATVFKDSYLVEFLSLPLLHSESDLQRGLVEQLKKFLIELGRDFCFVGSQYPLQVGGRDFSLDLLFFNRALNCLVVIELKVVEFEPEHLGKLQFYLEALDRDVKKPHEQPSIGVLLCATKNHEVVEYALSRSMSQALVAEYQTKMPEKKLLEAKLHEFYELAQQEAPHEVNVSKLTQSGVSKPQKKARKKRPPKTT